MRVFVFKCVSPGQALLNKALQNAKNNKATKVTVSDEGSKTIEQNKQDAC